MPQPSEPTPRPRNSHVPGQLIVRFKPEAVQLLADSPPPRSARAAAVAASMPEEVSGPLELLRNAAGLLSVKPLFVTGDKPKPAAGPMAMTAMRSALASSADTTRRKELRGFQLVESRQKKLPPALLKKLRASKAVDFVELVPNRWLSAEADPLLNRQWGLRAIRWFNGTLPNATTVHVAVLDSGIDAGHADLAAAIESYRHDGNKARDFLGHGTHVSGTIAAVTNNAVGIAGVADCRLHCWKVFDDPKKGSEEQDFNFEIYSEALSSALDSEVKVINLSIGGTESSQTEAVLFRQLRDDGVVVVAAMGNEFEEGNPKEFPAAYDSVLAVGAVDEVGRRATFSCTGAHIGLVAPGVNILSTVPRQKASFANATEYDSWPGTSMATPHVAGAAALLYAQQGKSKATADEIVDRLRSKARKLPGMKKKNFTKEFGSGLLDIGAALKP